MAIIHILYTLQNIILLINKDIDGLQLRIQELIDSLKLVCTVKK